MYKATILTLILFFNFTCWTQTIDGNYSAFELNGLSIDSTGKIYFYGIDSFSNQKNYFEVKVKIKGNQITVDKIPVIFKGFVKNYSTSEGGFITYSGKITKYGDNYIATTKMIDYDYMGVSFFEAPNIINDFDTTVATKVRTDTLKNETEKIRFAKYDRIKKNGLYVYFPKGTLKQDYIIKLGEGGIWINNTFYWRQKKM